MTDSSDDTPSDRVKKAMPGKKPLTEAPFKVIEGGKGAARKPRARKGKAKQPPATHEPGGPQDGLVTIHDAEKLAELVNLPPSPTRSLHWL